MVERPLAHRMSESNLWNLVKAVRAAERDYFGDYPRNLRVTELNAKKLLKRKWFRSAWRQVDTARSELPELAHSALMKGISTAQNGGDASAVIDLAAMRAEVPMAAMLYHIHRKFRYFHLLKFT